MHPPPRHDTHGARSVASDSRVRNPIEEIKRECELCERRTWCEERHGMTVCDLCDEEYLP